MLASEEEREQAGSEDYQGHHFGKILKEGFSFSGHERDHLYLNRGDDGFLDVGGISGIDSETDARGAAYADFDNDGDLDIFLTSFQGKAHHLFHNRVGQDAGFLRIALRGAASGPDAYGTIVRVKTAAGTQTQIKSGGAGFVSQNDPRLLFGLGDAAECEWIEVSWPSGAKSRFGPVAAGTSLRIEEGRPDWVRVEEERFSLPEPLADDSFLHLLAAAPGDAFPDIALTPLSGGATSAHALWKPGRHTLVNFWATHCVPCRKEMPELETLSGPYASQGLDIVGVSLDVGAGLRKVPRAVQQLGVTYPIYTTAEATFPALFKTDEYFIPISYIVGPDGKIVEVLKGWSAATRERLEAMLFPGALRPAP